MREEVKNLLKQAEADLRKVDLLFKGKEFDGVAFYSQQTVEKSLKALFILRFSVAEKTHSIVYLAQKLQVPNYMISSVMDLGPEYLVSRYPDMASGVPAELYDKNIATRHKKTAKKILKWVKKQIQK